MSDTITKKLLLFFPKCECEKPIIYHLVKDHDLIVNVFRAKVTPNEEGYLLLDVTGTEENIEKSIAFVKTFNVTVSFSTNGLLWDKDLCTHCGYCIPHCPTHALRLRDPQSREVMFDAEKCIECLACVRVCPYGACTSAF